MILTKNIKYTVTQDIKNDIIKNYNILIKKNNDKEKIYHIVISNPKINKQNKRSYNYSLYHILNDILKEKYKQHYSFLYVFETPEINISIDLHCHILLKSKLSIYHLHKIFFNTFYNNELKTVNYKKYLQIKNFIVKWKDFLFIEDITLRSDLITFSGYLIKQINNFNSLSYNYRVWNQL